MRSLRPLCMARQSGRTPLGTCRVRPQLWTLSYSVLGGRDAALSLPLLYLSGKDLGS